MVLIKIASGIDVLSGNIGYTIGSMLGMGSIGQMIGKFIGKVLANGM